MRRATSASSTHCARRDDARRRHRRHVGTGGQGGGTDGSQRHRLRRVVNGAQPVGIVTDRDIVFRCATTGNATSQMPVSLPSRPLRSASARSTGRPRRRDDPRSLVRRFPVVLEDRLVGVVSLGDLARRRDPGSVLADIEFGAPEQRELGDAVKQPSASASPSDGTTLTEVVARYVEAGLERCSSPSPRTGRCAASDAARPPPRPRSRCTACDVSKGASDPADMMAVVARDLRRPSVPTERWCSRYGPRGAPRADILVRVDRRSSDEPAVELGTRQAFGDAADGSSRRLSGPAGARAETGDLQQPSRDRRRGDDRERASAVLRLRVFADSNERKPDESM